MLFNQKKKMNIGMGSAFYIYIHDLRLGSRVFRHIPRCEIDPGAGDFLEIQIDFLKDSCSYPFPMISVKDAQNAEGPPPFS
jgi:hypothetical protein